MSFHFARPATLTALLASAIVSLAGATVRAELLYVSMGSGTGARILTYDISLSSSSAVQASVQTFTSGSTTTTYPAGLAFSRSGTNLYASNVQGSPTNISAFATSGTYLGRYGSGNGYMNTPIGIGTDLDGRIWYQNFAVPEIGFLYSSGSLAGSITVDSQQYTGLAVLSTGTGIQQQSIFTASYTGNKVVKYRGDGIIQQTISTNLTNPYGVALDSSNNLYVSNLTLNTISKFNSSGTFLTTIGGSATLSSPALLGLDSAGNLYVPNLGNNTISKFDTSGNFLFQWSTPAAPYGVAVAVVPEPSTWALALTGLGGLAALRRARRWRPAPHRLSSTTIRAAAFGTRDEAGRAAVAPRDAR
jgi:DNA-binding beta-propeller fold protein YncE